MKRYNLGLDLELFKSRLTITTEAYVRTTKDSLYRYTIPSSSGLETGDKSVSNPTVLGNLGNIQNKGIELDISYDAIKGRSPVLSDGTCHLTWALTATK